MTCFWLCENCLFSEAYDDFSALSLSLSEAEADREIQRISDGLTALMPISADFNAEAGWGIDDFSRSPCDCCQSELHGKRYRFVQL